MVTKYLIPFCLPLILCHFAYSILFNIILIWMGWMDGWMDFLFKRKCLMGWSIYVTYYVCLYRAYTNNNNKYLNRFLTVEVNP